jgi:hypothetical protein
MSLPIELQFDTALCAVGIGALGLTLVCIWGVLITIYLEMFRGGPYP